MPSLLRILSLAVPRKLLSVLCALIFLTSPIAAWAETSVSIQRGTFSYSTVDLSIDGLYPIILPRYYKNQRINSPGLADGPFGKGTHMGLYSLKAEFNPETVDGVSSLRFYLPTGEYTNFNCNPDNTCRNDRRQDSLRGIVARSGSAFVLKLEDGTSLTFDLNTGPDQVLRLTGIRYRNEPNSQSILFNYNADGTLANILSQRFGGSRGIFLSYYPNSQLVSQAISNPGGFTVSYTYNGDGTLATSTNPIHNLSVANASGGSRAANGVTTYSWGPDYQLVQITDPRGNPALFNDYIQVLDPTFTYNEYRVSRQRLPGSLPGDSSDDIITNYTYMYGGNFPNTLVFDFDAANNRREQKYDYGISGSYLRSVANSSDSSITFYNFDSNNGLLNSFTNSEGFATTFTYIDTGTYFHLDRVIESDTSIVTTFDFSDPFGQLRSLTDSINNTTTFTYAAEGWLTQLDTPLPSTERYTTYNAYGQVTRTEDGLGRVSTFEYAQTSQDLVRYTDSAGLATVFVYDDRSRITSTYLASASAHVTRFAYDQLNRITQVTQPDNRLTRYTYDDNSNVTSVTAANGVQTFYTHDASNQVSSRTQAGRTETYTYNKLGQLISKRDAKQQTTTYEYDLKGRLELVRFNNGETVNYDYDKNDRVVRVEDSSGAQKTVSFTYNNTNGNISGPLTVTTGSDTLTYSYDNGGNVRSVKRGSTDLLRYTYYGDNTLNTSTLVGQNGEPNLQVGVAYNLAGQPTLINYGYNDISSASNVRIFTTLAYNPQGDLGEIRFFAPNQTTLRQLNFSYNYATKGYLTTTTEGGQKKAANSYTYTYNSVGAVTNTLIVDSKGASHTFSQHFDLDGNPMHVNQDGGTGTVGYQSGNNRLTRFAERTVQTDNNGNVSRQFCAAACASIDETYVWNSRDQLVSYTNPVIGVSAAFVYDALGRRIEKVVNGVSTRYVYSGEQVIEQTTNGTTKRYLVGQALDDVYGSRVNGADEFLLHDPLNNSVIGLVDAASLQVKVAYNYTPFGTPLVSSLDDYNAVDNALLFAGRELDILGTTLYYFRARYYSADLHRFVSEDPIGFAGGDTNLYRYVGNRPHVANDPTGLYGGGCFEGCAPIPTFKLNASDSSGNVLATGRRFSLNIGAFRNDDGANVPDDGVPITLVAQVIRSYARDIEVDLPSFYQARVQTRINIAKGQTRTTPLRDNGNPASAGLEHVISRHFGGRNSSSQFTITVTELVNILRRPETIASSVTAINSGSVNTIQFVRNVDTGGIVGTVRQSQGGGLTTVLRIITDRAGNLITTFPVPKP